MTTFSIPSGGSTAWGSAAAGAATATPLQPNYPTSASNGAASANDIILMFGHLKPSTATMTASGSWTQVDQVTGGGGSAGDSTGPTKLGVWWRAIPGGGLTTTTDVTLGSSPNVAQGCMVQVRPDSGTAVTWSHELESLSVSSAGTSYSGSASAAPAMGLQTGDQIFVCVLTPDNESTVVAGGVPTVTAAGATISAVTTITEVTSGSGNDIGSYLGVCTVTAGSSSSAPAISGSTSSSETRLVGFLVVRATGSGEEASAGNASVGMAAQNATVTVDGDSPPLYRSVSANHVALATTCVVNKPAGTAEFDLLVAYHTMDTDTAATAMTAPAGWDQVGTTSTQSGVSHTKVWVKTAGASEGSTYTFGAGSGSDTSVTIVAVNPNGLINLAVDAGPAFGGSGSSATSLVAPAVTTTDSLTLLINGYYLFTTSNAWVNFTAAGTSTERIESPPSPTAAYFQTMVSTEALTASGSTGTRTATVGTGYQWSAMSIAVAGDSAGIDADAEYAALAVAGQNAAANYSSAPSIGAASVGMAAQNATVATSIARTPDEAPVAFAAQDPAPSISLSRTAGFASPSMVAETPNRIDISPTAGAAEFSAAGQDAAVSDEALSPDAEVAAVGFAAQGAAAKVAPAVGVATFALAAHNVFAFGGATAAPGNAAFALAAVAPGPSVKVSAGSAGIGLTANNVINSDQLIACAFFTATVTVDQHFGLVTVDAHTSSVTIDAHEGVVGVEEHYATAEICGRS